MKKTFIICLAVQSFIMIGCVSNPIDKNTDVSMVKPVSVSGKITKIENGKDGYTATIIDTAGKEYIVTVSVMDLQKNGEPYQLYKVGDTISVTGPT
ncbi:hypothetical protein [Chryseobacterium sp. T20]|uniref:hypothetical protein n=1 Tax=Chryseobacterium sp. T20 TaxID=3395375 RepID=UPI0039BD56D5